MPATSPPPILGVLLAAGKSRRMGGGDKCLKDLAGKTILARVIERAHPQVAELVLVANGDPARFAEYAIPVIQPSLIEGQDRPLVTVLAGMEWAAVHRPDLPWVASFATDMPFFPTDLVKRLFAAMQAKKADIVFAESGELSYVVFALWSMLVAGPLRQGLTGEVANLESRFRQFIVRFPAAPVPPFFNINTPEDLAEAERLLKEHGEPR